MSIKLTLDEARVPVQVWTDDIEGLARDQLINVAKMPFVHHHVAAMPDVHAGIGATIGSVIPTHRAIIPAAVGVDIGCGMVAAQLSLNAEQLPDSLSAVRGAIEARVPVGFAKHDEADVRAEAVERLKGGYARIVDQHPKIVERLKDKGNWARQIGTLGGGNHFVEICLDERDQVWVMLHSGSRGIGNLIGHYFISRAKEAMLRQDVHLPDKDLAYLEQGKEDFDDYVEAVDWAQTYAAENRTQMLELVLLALREHLPAFQVMDHAINCHHNYVVREAHYGEEVFVTRKGAIRAGLGDLGIIPGSMGAKSFIVRGKGSAESFCSCSHGAGRKMSRNAAKKRFSAEDLARQTEGVECRKDAGVIDEAPGAYKDIDVVMENQSDLVEIVHTLKQVVCVKG